MPSKTIYEKNLMAFKLRYPHLADKIMEEYPDNENEVVPLIEKAKDFSEILKVHKNGKEWLLNSKYYPEVSVENWIKQFSKIEYKATFVIFGLGNGLYAKKILEKTEKTVHIIIYEPSKNIFDTVMKNIDIAELCSDRVYLVVKGLNKEDFQMIHNAYVIYSNLSVSKHICYPNYDKIFVEEYKDYFQQIRRIVERMTIDRNTELAFSKSITINSLENMKYVFTNSTVNQLYGKIPMDIPAIIVAAGPSLNKNIHHLKKAKNKAFLIATDTAVKPMLKAGIIPDIFITVDSQKPLTLFEDEKITNIPVCAIEMSNSKVLNLHKGKKMFASNGNRYIGAIFEKYDKLYEGLETGGSVANNAFSLAERLGITTIILVGQDLAYTDNKSHADGTFEKKIKETKEYDPKQYIDVEDIHGNKVKTLINLKYYKEWFEDKIEKNKELKVIDATEGGAKIIGTEIISLEDAIERECHREVNFELIIAKTPNVFRTEELKEIVEYIEEIPQKLDLAKKKAKAGIKDYKELQDFFEKEKFNTKEFQKLNRRIKKLTDYMEEAPELEIILPYIKLIDYQVSSDVFETKDSIVDEGLTIASKGILMLKAIKQAIEELEPNIKAMVEGIKGEVDNVK